MEISFHVNGCHYGFEEKDLKSDSVQFLLSITSLCQEVEHALESQVKDLREYMGEHPEMPEAVASAIIDKINHIQDQYLELRKYTGKIYSRIFLLSRRKLVNRDHKRSDLLVQMDSGKCACY